jgi:hypothetical protein
VDTNKKICRIKQTKTDFISEKSIGTSSYGLQKGGGTGFDPPFV